VCLGTLYVIGFQKYSQVPFNVVAEWLGRRTLILNQRVVGSNPGEGTAWYL
jgi:hypothetical protein